MSCVTTDRWTCPTCERTEVLKVVTTQKRALARLRRVQEDHARVHAAERRRSALRGLP